ncbi:hypothetical protein COCCADRAFT_89192 [Bipolaris zeicola 26-R-13]|uniref:Uncharacterized protein n=1 Tax=Cochliobolus carbonum (strain 26-R-13) TaxID=930089 RepID=W6YX22_COCC2|nr:uncharacterized protein COCCADRAFT_89192 [Bipolaris zeicola 26-R-13]EUC36061.1 hypothetical protein COCCADRAFT_89192 [Bipolaris zeicola 26-R-13]
MRFTIIAASLVAAVAAQYPAASETCAAPVTVTVTKTLGHTPVAPSSGSAYYPTTVAVYPTSTPLVPEASTVISGAPPAVSGTAAPTGTGAPIPEFTGAASSIKVGSALAGLGAVAALLL